MLDPLTGRGLLLDILSWARPHKSECERRFLREYLDPIAGMKQDRFGNRYLRIGDTPVMWSCHVDTVARHGGPQEVAFDPETGIASLANGKPKMSLGADDGVGVWIMLEMIRHARPGLYVFHRGEEVGCLGSEHILRHEPHILDGIRAAIAFDRAGAEDVITHQSFGMTASDDFAKSIADQLNTSVDAFTYRPDNTGVYTDTNTYAGVIEECTNLSVGYERQHSHNETLDVFHAEALLAAMLEFDIGKLVFARAAGDDGYVGYQFDKAKSRKWDDLDSPFEELMELIDEAPHIAAMLLMGRGVTPKDYWDELLDLDEATDAPWEGDYRREIMG